MFSTEDRDDYSVVKREERKWFLGPKRDVSIRQHYDQTLSNTTVFEVDKHDGKGYRKSLNPFRNKEVAIAVREAIENELK